MACVSKTDYKRRLRESPPEIFHTQHLQKTPLRALALCQTRVQWEDGRSTPEVTYKVFYDTDKIGEFLMRHWPGLNEMTEWLSISVEENKKISFDIIRCLGIEVPDDLYLVSE